MPSIPGMGAIGFLAPSISSSSTLIRAISSLGLTSGLQMCLDAGDSGSYSSGQTWADLSGNAYNFYRGTGSGSDSADPTFNGTPGTGGSSNYWTFNGSQYFTATQSNPTWVNSLHKDSAKFAFCGWLYHSGTPEVIFATSDSDGFHIGIRWGISSSFPNSLILIVEKDSNPVSTYTQSTTATFASGWNFFGLRVDEANNTAVFQIGGTQETYACTYNSPSGSNASFTARVCAEGDASYPFPSGSRFSSLAGWSTTIPATSDLLALYTATRTAFGV